MLLVYFLFRFSILTVIVWAIQSFVYMGVLKKMGEDIKWAIIPFLAEWKISHRIFKSMKTFYYPAILTLICLAYRFYISPLGTEPQSYVQMGLFIYAGAAALIYGTFLTIFYWRLAKCFGKNIPFRIGTVLFPFIFLFIIGRDKSEFTQPVFTYKQRSKLQWWIYNIASALCFFVIAGGAIIGASLLLMQTLPPRFIVQSVSNDFYNRTKDIKVTKKVVTRKDTMGADYASLKDMPTSREKYYLNNDKAENVVVMQYIIGSNLESQMGFASDNILGEIDATKAGDNLTFVVQAGGSDRWFTQGIDDRTVGRYTIKNGTLKKEMDLDPTTCMSTPESLSSFIKWAKKNHPADRYVLVLWDHGGGFVGGYGQDSLNARERTEENRAGTILTNEVVEAIKDAGVNFDIIGFDACLMQDIETAYNLEPYADYLLASEEVENGFGWCYEPGFSLFAKDPTTPSEEFGKVMVSSFDEYNRANNNEKRDPSSTLSFVDLTRIKPAYEQLMEYYDVQKEAILGDPQDYTDIAISADKAYAFTDKLQIDLIGYLNLLNKADYDETIGTSQQKKDLIKAVRAAVVCHNKDSRKGIHGMALSFPYANMDNYYTDTYNQYRAFEMSKPEDFYNDFFSIMAAQKMEETAEDTQGFNLMPAKDYTKEKWYKKGFEDYVPKESVDHIKLNKTDNGYTLDLQEDIRRIVVDQEEAVFLKDGKNYLSLGATSMGEKDKDGNLLLKTDGKWFQINNVVIPYTEEEQAETDDGTIYKARVKALLNDTDRITLSIEWDPVKEGDTELKNGRITGYVQDDNLLGFMEKGEKTLQSGDKLQFVFDIYNEKGELKNTKASGPAIRVRSQGRLKVEKKATDGDLRYRLQAIDSFQRAFQSELIKAK